jgi:hypothetical protein
MPPFHLTSGQFWVVLFFVALWYAPAWGRKVLELRRDWDDYKNNRAGGDGRDPPDALSSEPQHEALPPAHAEKDDES